MDIIVLLINKHLKSIPLCFIFYVHLSNVFWFRNVLWLKNGIYLIKTIFKTFFPWNRFVKVCEARYMGNRVFNPVYYVLVMSEGQIIGLACGGCPAPCVCHKFSVQLALPISPEIMDRFWCSRCLNDHIDLANMIRSLASGANAPWWPKIEIRKTFQTLRF